nr:neuropeptide FF receptor 1-like [Anolis sagrei ordinatus]
MVAWVALQSMEVKGSSLAWKKTGANKTETWWGGIRSNSTFLPYYQHSPAVAAILVVAYLLAFLSCMAGNTLVCLVVLRNPRMRTVTNLFILNLAVSDLLVGICCVPTTLMDNLITGGREESLFHGSSGKNRGIDSYSLGCIYF